MIKKLFTSILLCGVAVASYALQPGENDKPNPVTASFSDGTITVNYDATVGKVSTKFITDALEAALGPNGADIKKPERKAAVTNIELTGDWTNYHLKKDQNLIFKIVEEFSKVDDDPNTEDFYVGLDLSACEGFDSRFVSVEDKFGETVYGPDEWFPGNSGDVYTVTFTSLPDEVEGSQTQETRSNPVTVETTYYYEFWGTQFDPESGIIPDNQQDNWLRYEKIDDEWYVVTKYNGTQKANKISTTTYTFINENGVEEVRDQYNMSGIRYDANEDKYWYDYTVTIVTDPVIKFSFDGYGKVFSSISFPTTNFTYIPDNLLLNQTNLTTAVIPNTVVAIGNNAFQKTALSGELVLSQNITEIGGLAFEGTNLESVNLSNTKIKKLRYGTFEDCYLLESVTFPSTLIEIQKVAFAEDELLESVDLSGCHQLRMIAGHAFLECQGLLSVKVCSHPKTIKGGEGGGAFNTCQHIQRVEITACSHIEGIEDVTDVTRCWCEAGAFDALITRVQTQFENASQGAHLIFPRTAPVLNSGNFENPYASAFDFFVGDYKAGAPINQSNLEVFYKDVPVPNEGYSVDGFGEPVNQPSLPALVGDARYNNNGWLEFINIDELEIIVPNDNLFLRTYSRTAGTGPVLLPVGDDAIHAFRVLDYRNTTKESDFDGEVVKDEDGNLLTLHGYIVLKELTVKDKNGVIRGYVPENTGVVYYSKKIDEVAGLILKEATTADLAAGESFTEYPNTDTDFDQTDPATTTSSVNMLVPSKGDPIGVTPTSPWNDKKNCYENPRTHRNFSLDATAKKWKRVKVGTLRANRAYVHLPISRFNNEDEPDAMNDFNEEDNGLTNLTAVGMIFEGDEATEIITIDAKGNITQDEGWYTLQGVKVTRPTKGVYIHNNKKVVFK